MASLEAKARIASLLAAKKGQKSTAAAPPTPATSLATKSIHERYKGHIAAVEANQRAIAAGQK